MCRCGHQTTAGQLRTRLGRCGSGRADTVLTAGQSTEYDRYDQGRHVRQGQSCPVQCPGNVSVLEVDGDHGYVSKRGGVPRWARGSGVKAPMGCWFESNPASSITAVYRKSG